MTMDKVIIMLSSKSQVISQTILTTDCIYRCWPCINCKWCLVSTLPHKSALYMYMTSAEGLHL